MYKKSTYAVNLVNGQNKTKHVWNTDDRKFVSNKEWKQNMHQIVNYVD